MPSLKTFIDSPAFYDGTELSATDVNILRNNAEAIKTASLRGLHVHNIHRVLQTQNGGLVWSGGFQYRQGLTTARFVIYTRQVSGMGEHSIVIYFNGVEVYRYDIASTTTRNVGGFTTVDIPINTRGYADYEIVTVDIIPLLTSSSGDATKGEQWVFDAYTFPYSNVVTSIWPGVPSFGTINATKLNQLSNGLDYLANRTAIMPYPLQMNMTQWMGTNNWRYPKFRYFRVKFANQNNRFVTQVYYNCQHNSAKIRLTIGGVSWDFGPYTKGQNVLIPINVDGIASGLSWNVDYLGSLEEVVLVKGTDDGRGGFVFGRISSGPLAIGSNGYSMPSTPVTSGMLESISYSSLQTRLNAIANITNTAYSNITSNPMVFDRGYMFRNRYGVTIGQNEYWTNVFIAGKYRAGDVLWVKGRDLRICYGPVTTTVKAESKPNDLWETKWLFEENLTDGDKITQAYFYLDQFKNLYPGMVYYVLGTEINYAAEHLR